VGEAVALRQLSIRERCELPCKQLGPLAIDRIERPGRVCPCRYIASVTGSSPMGTHRAASIALLRTLVRLWNCASAIADDVSIVRPSASAAR
jgi:hypothetical protein